MRIAIGFFGHLRTFETTAPSLRNFFHGDDDIDIFMHSWSTYEATSPSWWKEQSVGDSRSPVDQKKITTVYKLKKLVIEDQIIDEKSFKNTFGASEIPFQAVMFMLQSMRQCIKLIHCCEQDEDFEYDAVFMLRPDVQINQKIDIKKVCNALTHKKNTIIHFPLNSYPIFDDIDIFIKYGAMDVFFCSKAFVLNNVLDDLSQVRNSFKKLLKMHPNISNPEVAFHHYLKEKMINSIFKKINYSLVRMNGFKNINSQFFENRDSRSARYNLKRITWRRFFG